MAYLNRPSFPSVKLKVAWYSIHITFFVGRVNCGGAFTSEDWILSGGIEKFRKKMLFQDNWVDIEMDSVRVSQKLISRFTF
jgi:hypothetical protein